VSLLEAPLRALDSIQPVGVTGIVAALRGLTLLVDDLPLPVGSLVRVERPADHAAPPRLGEVVGFTRDHAVVMLLGQTSGVRAGDRVAGVTESGCAWVGDAMRGRVVNGLGEPIDGRGPIHDLLPRPLRPDPVPSLTRRRIDGLLVTGVRAIDLMASVGRGQRVGIFAGPGVGKSTLLAMTARRTEADVNVLALVGERGREVRDFIERGLGPEGLARSVVVVATGDESPLLRIRAALLACTIAEHFRDLGRDVLLLMDSITRFAHAQRQVGLSVGEPPATRGYTPSVFSSLPLLLERAGAAGERGSITGLYTVLVEGDDLTEPVADAARGILDGHVILSRRFAQRAHYPAIDVLDSVSRVADDVCDPALVSARRQVLRLLAAHAAVEDLVQIGAYAAGSNPEADVALQYAPRIMELLRQERDETPSFADARAALVKIALEAAEHLRRPAQPRGR
jgi:flagellum-specific ATP synthase